MAQVLLSVNINLAGNRQGQPRVYVRPEPDRLQQKRVSTSQGACGDAQGTPGGSEHVQRGESRGSGGEEALLCRRRPGRAGPGAPGGQEPREAGGVPGRRADRSPAQQVACQAAGRTGAPRSR